MREIAADLKVSLPELRRRILHVWMSCQARTTGRERDPGRLALDPDAPSGRVNTDRQTHRPREPIGTHDRQHDRGEEVSQLLDPRIPHAATTTNLHNRGIVTLL